MSGPFLQGVAALIAAVGGIAVFFLKVWTDRRDQQARRSEKIGDMMRALHADIAIERDRLDRVFSDANAPSIEQELLENVTARKPKPMPITSSGGRSFVLESLKDDLSILPSDAIGPVIRFYRLSQGLGTLEDAFAAGAYDGIEAERQMTALRAYFANGAEVLAAAEVALRALDAHAGQRLEARDRRRRLR